MSEYIPASHAWAYEPSQLKNIAAKSGKNRNLSSKLVERIRQLRGLIESARLCGASASEIRSLQSQLRVDLKRHTEIVEQVKANQREQRARRELEELFFKVPQTESINSHRLVCVKRAT